VGLEASRVISYERAWFGHSVGRDSSGRFVLTIVGVVEVKQILDLLQQSTISVRLKTGKAGLQAPEINYSGWMSPD